jgi:hypothetical protein
VAFFFAVLPLAGVGFLTVFFFVVGFFACLGANAFSTLASVHESAANPRSSFDESKLAELAESLRGKAT